MFHSWRETPAYDRASLLAENEIDGPALVGLKNVPSGSAIVGGLPKIGIDGYDPIGRHTSTPQFQTPRTWNPRATLSMDEKKHLLKLGFEFVNTRTRINDLAAPIGAMDFSGLFSGSSVGDLLLGLPSLLALTSLHNAMAKEGIIRAGIVGCDTSHVEAFTKLINNPDATGPFADVEGPAAAIRFRLE